MIGFGEYVEARQIFDYISHDMEMHFRLPCREIRDLKDHYGTIIAQVAKYAGSVDDDAENRIVMSINELIHNALKYRSSCTSIFVRIVILGDKLAIEVHNTVDQPTKFRFIRYLATLFNADLDQMYYNQIHYLSEHPDSDRASVGLITLLKDYGTQLGYIANESDNKCRIIAYALVTLEIKSDH